MNVFSCYVVFAGNGDQQLKNFNNLDRFAEWCSRNSEKIVKVNGVLTECIKLSEDDAFKIVKGITPKSVKDQRSERTANLKKEKKAK